MVADLSLLSLSSKGEANGGRVVNESSEGSWTWSPNKIQDDDDDSWEVKAFAEDTSNIMGAIWPPRSYTCTFCRREFRSAQALGGHMNVHRKDRARLNQSQFQNPCYHNSMSASSSSSPSPLVIPTNQEFASDGRLCVLYQLPHGNGICTPSRMNARALDSSSSSSSFSFSSSSSSSFISIPPYPPNTNLHRQLYPQGNIERSTQRISDEGQGNAYKVKSDPFKSIDFNGGFNEEIDLELRLGK